MKYETDTAIIGGGPAGISCAIRLRQLGVPCVVIERSTYPRRKTCGGMMTEKTYNAFEKLLGDDAGDLTSVICESANEVSLYNGREMLAKARVSKIFRGVRREVFDAYLAEKHRLRGGIIIEGAVCRPDGIGKDTLELINGDTVSFKHLVVADGAASATRRALGYPQIKRGFCVETFIPRSEIPDLEEPRIYFGIVKTGYAWVFPAKDEICIGLGEVYDQKTPYKKRFRSFLKLLGVDPEGKELEGAFLPYGSTVGRKDGAENVILIGDAGGYAHPIYGEGLYYAVKTGAAAAEAIAKRADAARSEFVNKTAFIEKTIRNDTKFRKFFFSPATQKTFVSKIKGRNRFLGYFCDENISADEPHPSPLEVLKNYKKAYKK